MGSATAKSTDGRSRKRPGVEEQTSVIMRAAVSLIAAQGARAVSIAQICDAAHVSRPTFYRCFEDKDALISHIYEEAVDTHVASFLGAADLRDAGGLQASLNDLLDAIFEHAQLAQLVFIESSDPASPAAEIVDSAFEHAADVMTGNGKKGNAPSRVYLKAIMAAVQWIVQDAIRKGLSPVAKREAKSAAYALVTKALA